MVRRGVTILGLVALLVAVELAAEAPGGGAGGSWYFAVSGDSRDCGDLIMPKIARDIQSLAGKTSVAFYWHLGDFRRMFDIDCDMLLVVHPGFDCRTPRKDVLGANDMHDYLTGAWDDFLAHQVAPFGPVQVFLGIGNHELYSGRTREDFRKKFEKWLIQEPLHSQRMSDFGRELYSDDGDTTYHFVRGGVDFVFLDDAGEEAFTAAQITWLAKLLAGDDADPTVKAIVVGTHAALPFSTARGHAIDDTCQGRCSGEQVYDMLYQAQNLGGPAEKQKHVYIFASHSHYFAENVYDTPEHHGQVLPGWVVGTAGAEQYVPTIRYGYLLVEVRPDSTLGTQFRDVTRDSLPLASGPGAANLTEYCFAFNKRQLRPRTEPAPPCPCAAAR